MLESNVPKVIVGSSCRGNKVEILDSKGHVLIQICVPKKWYSSMEREGAEVGVD